MRIASLFVALVMVGCSDLFTAVQKYDLVSVDGQALPWSSPAGNGGFIASGSVKIDDDTLAERSELTNTGSWTVSGRYQVKQEMLIIDYGMIRLSDSFEELLIEPAFYPCPKGPARPPRPS